MQQPEQHSKRESKRLSDQVGEMVEQSRKEERPKSEDTEDMAKAEEKQQGTVLREERGRASKPQKADVGRAS